MKSGKDIGESMKKQIWFSVPDRRRARVRTVAGASVVLLFSFGAVVSACAAEGSWELSEKGNRWQYLYGPEDPAEDTWIEEDGKEYYVDSNGYMKTGWVTDKDTGEKYYLGADGVKCYRCFTPDGHYVDSEGKQLTKFDTYRKKVKSVLNKQISEQKKALKAQKSNQKKATGNAANTAAVNTEDFAPGAALVDLNWDGYLDVVVTDFVRYPDRVTYAAIWNPETEELDMLTEADYRSIEEIQEMYHVWDSSDVQGELGVQGIESSEGTGSLQQAVSKSQILLDAASEDTWLICQENEWNQDYFLLAPSEAYFESRWQFRTEVNDWEELEYYFNEKEMDWEDWELSRREAIAEVETGTQMPLFYVPLTKEQLNELVDRAPSEEEEELWN